MANAYYWARIAMIDVRFSLNSAAILENVCFLFRLVQLIKLVTFNIGEVRLPFCCSLVLLTTNISPNRSAVLWIQIN